LNFVEFRLGAAIAIAAGLGGELGVHGGVLVGFTLDGQFQAAGQHRLFGVFTEAGRIVDHQLRVEQAEVSEGVLGFLGGSVAKEFGQFGLAELFGHVGEEEIFAVGHALAAEGGLEIGVGGGVVQIHGCVGGAQLSAP
jgi:hypothetical protein